MASPGVQSQPNGAGNPFTSLLGVLLKHNDILLAVGMITIILMMLIPLPPIILDVLLTINLALSVTILLVTLYTKEPLQYSTFPTLLLVSTLFRLGLNVSSTRLILLSGEAGEVIKAFGNFVVGGNYVVGLLIFIILMIINFLVITNGAGRVSEVSARFTLDALPGKQLSIDADLNSGIINEKEAKRRRNSIQKEADFYGTMDGASKFVKGDAIAGIIITVINIIFGLIIGVVQMGMEPAQAAATFTILTVGDGLISSLPALIISASTGILVTRVSEDDDASLGDELSKQLLSNHKVLFILAGLLLLMGLVPGMPNVPFLFIGAVAGAGAWYQFQQSKTRDTRTEAQKDADEAAEALAAKETKKTSTEEVLDMLHIEPMELELGYRLVPLIEAENGGDLLERIANIRKQIAQDYGIVLPSIRVRDNLHIEPDAYQLKLRGISLGEGKVMADMLMAMATDPDLADEVEGIPTTEPAFGLPALWIDKAEREEAEINGFTVIHPSAVLATHLTELVKRNQAQVLTRTDVKQLLDNLKKTSEAHESLVDDLIPGQLSISELHLVLQMLLMESVSIRDLSTILESVSYHCRISKSPEYLVEQARVALSRNICKQHLDEGSGKLPVLTLAPDVEETMARHMIQTGGEGQAAQSMLALDPQYTQTLLGCINKQVEEVLTMHGMQPVLLCNAKLRHHVRKLIERMLPQVAVLSYNEIGPSVQVQSFGSLRVG